MPKPLSSLVCVQVGPIDWFLRPEYADHFAGGADLRLDDWLASNQARIVKAGSHRIVYRLDRPGLPCYLKHNRVSDLRTRLRQVLRPGKARREFTLALEIGRRGVPTIEPIAFGEFHTGPRRGESVLLTRSLEQTIQFDEFLYQVVPSLPPLRLARLRLRLAPAVGRFLACLHEAGVEHHDLHSGNVLIRVNEDEPELFLIDLHALRLRSPLDWPASAANLVIFNRWLSLRCQRTDRLRCWHAYVQARGPAFEKQFAGVKAEARFLEEATRRSNDEFWLRRQQRCLQKNGQFRPVRTRGLVGHVVTDLDSELLQRLLADPEAPFRDPGVRTLKEAPGGTVIEFTATIGGRPQSLIYKRFPVGKLTDPLAALFRPSPALRSWLAGHGLRERGLPTPRPLLVLHRRWCGLQLHGYVLMEKVEPALDLHGHLDEISRLPSPQRERVLRGRIDQLAALIRALHARQLSHRDLKAPNILVNPASDWRTAPAPAFEPKHPPDPTTVPFWLVDLVGVAHTRELSLRQRIKNLTRLHASFWKDARLTRTDKLRFLRAYMQWNLHGAQGWKKLWRGIASGTAAKVARNRRLGRRVE